MRMKKCEDYSEEEYRSIMSTNLEGPYNMCQLAYPMLKASANGSIVFISSVAGIVSIPMISVYAAAKGIFAFCLINWFSCLYVEFKYDILMLLIESSTFFIFWLKS